MKNKSLRYILPLMIPVLVPGILYAADGKPGEKMNVLLVGLVSLAVILLIAIMVIGNVVRQMAFVYRDKMREERKKSLPVTLPVIFIALFFTGNSFAETTSDIPAVASTISGIAKADFYLLMGIIAIELLVLFSLSIRLMRLSNLLRTRPETDVAAKLKAKISFWDKMNKSVTVEKEQDIMLDHNYDGIRELDNSLPPWWIYGFYATILISVVYIWYYHAGGNGPSSYDEYVAQVQKGEAEKAVYLAQAANLVDENNVKILDAEGMAAGAITFKASCAACHAVDGGGGVGPNLTDEYWLHGGSLSDVFKSIKYGWPDKGMKSWKDDFSPKQIAELTSYVKSLKGTAPAAPKDKQGELFIEAESTKEATDKSVVAK